MDVLFSDGHGGALERVGEVEDSGGVTNTEV